MALVVDFVTDEPMIGILNADSLKSRLNFLKPISSLSILTIRSEISYA